MPYLLFQLNGRPFALDATEIEAIAPLPDLSAVPLAPPHVAGLFHYHGRLVPLLDLQILAGGAPCKRVFSTRIIIVRDNDETPLGLLAEEVLDVVRHDATSDLSPRLDYQERAWLEPTVFLSEDRLVQPIHWQALLTPQIHALARNAS